MGTKIYRAIYEKKNLNFHLMMQFYGCIIVLETVQVYTKLLK